MNINRNNYEEVFMLYADNELSAAQRSDVECFVAANPDLQQELQALMDLRLTPDALLTFPGKQDLLRPVPALDTLNAENCLSYFVLYADDELMMAEKSSVEAFVYRHPRFQDEFEAILQAKLVPDRAILFDNKEALYRHERERKIVPFAWWRLAAAAVVLLALGILWLNRPASLSTRQDMAGRIHPAVSAPETRRTVETVHPGATQKTVVSQQPDQQDKQPQAAADQLASVQPAKASPQAKKMALKATTRPAPVETSATANIAGVDDNNDTRLTARNIGTAQPTQQTPAINTTIAAAAAGPGPDQPSILSNKPDNNAAKAELASSRAADDEKLEILNTSVNAKNPLRGILRKASRLIAKKGSMGDGNGEHRGILIGGFEIAVR